MHAKGFIYLQNMVYHYEKDSPVSSLKKARRGFFTISARTSRGAGEKIP
jgi:hypothetical protein